MKKNGNNTKIFFSIFLILNIILIQKIKAEENSNKELTDKTYALDKDKVTKEDQDRFGLIYRSVEKMRFGAYGESNIRYQETPDGDEFGFDPHRIVLLGGYNITDSIIFNLEIEFEHGGVSTSSSDKMFQDGEIAVEQAYIDFLLNEYFNWRSLGIDVVPFGYINLFHEPTNYYSTNRPELYRDLIPSTWFEGSSSIFGKITDNLNYQFQISVGLEDNADSQDSGMLAPGIDGNSGLRNARPTVGDFQSSNNVPGFAFRLAYEPSFLPGLAGSSSAYFTETTPRAVSGFFVPGSTYLTMLDTEFRYRMPFIPFELRAEYVHIFLINNENLLANNDGDPTNNTGNFMNGASGEIAYHFKLSKISKLRWDLVPFYRFSYINLQSSGYQGIDINLPTGTGDRYIHTFGGALFINPKVVLKLDYSIPTDDAPTGPDANRLQFGIGWFF